MKKIISLFHRSRIGCLVLIGVVGIMAAWFGIASAVWGLGVATAGIYGKGEARKQIQSAPFRLQAYQSFFDACASIQGLEGQIDELELQLQKLTPDTRSYYFTLSSLTGTKGLRHTAIAKYNQDASKDYTEGQFRDKDLPYRIQDNSYPEGVKTICATR